MAKKDETIDMVDRFSEFKELKNIDKTTMISVLEESFRSVIAKMFGSDENFDVIMNPDKGDCEIYQNLEIVPDGEVVDPVKQISITDAKNDPDDPDPVTPSGPKPPIVVVPEEPVPTTPGEEPGTEIPEEETPKAEVPETGDMSLLWLAMTALSGSGLAAVSLRKKRDEE